MPASDFFNSKSKIFLFGCLVFISGLALASFLPASPAGGSSEILNLKIWWFIAAIFFLVLTLLPCATAEALAARGRATRATNAGHANIRFWRLGFLSVAILLFAIWRYSVSLPVNTPDKIWHYNLQAVTVRGYVANEPDVRETSQKLEINVGTIRELSLQKTEAGVHELPLRKISGKLLVTTDLYPEYQYGDSLEMACALEAPEEFQGFAYDRYLARYDVYSVCYYPMITPLNPPLSGGMGNSIYRKIFQLKKILAGLIDAGMSEPESSLARPIVFGGQKGLSQDIRNDFQKVGLTHIMAVSGFNISILSAIVMVSLLALGLSRRYAFYLAVVFLVGYIILVGAPASAMRAGLMGFLVLWALKLGRLNKITNSLVLTAAILLIINPKLLRDDVGFQLSFLAIAGLVYVYPIFVALREKFKLPELKGVSDALFITLAAQVFTLPVIAYNFSQISLIAPLANLAVLWTLPILTVFILAALPLSFILPGLAFIFFLPSLILTKYILATVKFFAGFKYSYIEVNYLSWGWVVLYYVLVIFIIIKLRRSKLLSEEISDKI